MNIPQQDVVVPLHALEPQASHWREVLMVLPAAIYTTDMSGRITFYNEAAAELWGHRPRIGQDEWCGSWRLRWPDGTPMKHEECPMAVALREEREVRGSEAIAERPDGTRVPFLAFPTPLRDRSGKMIGALNMLVDLSTQKKREESQQLLSAIVESSDDAIVSKDLGGIIRSWNKGAERLFGYTARETIGKPITMLIPEDRQNEEPGIIERIRKGERVDHYETVRLRKDGSKVSISLTVSPIKDSTGRVIGASKIARDISERKESQHRILMLMREVNHRVKNQYAVILSMIRETSKRSRDSLEFEKQVRNRIMALARSHDLLVLAEWRGATVFELLLAQVKPFGNEDCITMSGPSIVLQPNAVQYLGIAFHELATNSAKYGALSAFGGTIKVEWTLERDSEGKKSFCLSWAELGGPAVAEVTEHGFGKIVLEKVTPTALGGVGAVTYAPDGVTWTLRAPMTYLEASAEDDERGPELIAAALS
ncbi:PAS domain S-box protein [Allomesorhizobium camelthorni]|uniref:Blue-light-activated histidine kinase n=1 Tax=Allomesorhizobium camelthorni TaxID=475069 RepID=A0A6G4W8E7_9HYPH|nr:PAS domain S-box protein [Mesorhizobium camelthorni]NGO51041.1 PAS domain S-box protein [Mesorhizobium camelthorni]